MGNFDRRRIQSEGGGVFWSSYCLGVETVLGSREIGRALGVTCLFPDFSL